jgi:ketosteroid isomerase-like protein
VACILLAAEQTPTTENDRLRHGTSSRAALDGRLFFVAAKNSAEIFKQWMAAINDHDVSVLTRLMAADHVFVDSLGNRVVGATSMEAGWRGYFGMCPDYWIRADYAMADGETMLVAGEAGGTLDGESWRTPAAWRVVIRDGRVLEWQVFADNKPVYEILGKPRR